MAKFRYRGYTTEDSSWESTFPLIERRLNSLSVQALSLLLIAADLLLLFGQFIIASYTSFIYSNGFDLSYFSKLQNITTSFWIASIVIRSILVVEVFLRLIAYGIVKYTLSHWCNIPDIIVTVACVICRAYFGISALGTSLALIILLRFGKLIQFYNTRQDIQMSRIHEQQRALEAKWDRQLSKERQRTKALENQLDDATQKLMVLMGETDITHTNMGHQSMLPPKKQSSPITSPEDDEDDGIGSTRIKIPELHF